MYGIDSHTRGISQMFCIHGDYIEVFSKFNWLLFTSHQDRPLIGCLH